jgi:hypothetical protein
MRNSLMRFVETHGCASLTAMRLLYECARINIYSVSFRCTALRLYKAHVSFKNIRSDLQNIKHKCHSYKIYPYSNLQDYFRCILQSVGIRHPPE